MYQTCMFCKKPLGSNEVVESFPVGRRLSFDAAKGRLWVVCRSCERWNLTPLEERWEAVETCEKLFHDTRVRTSSENIGLAKHREGLELVRIGKPLRPEFAAWRYGDQFGRRRRRYIAHGVTAAVLGGAAYAGGLAIGLPTAVGIQILGWARLLDSHRRRARFLPADGKLRSLNRRDVYATRIVPADDGLGLRVGWRSLHGKPDWFEGDDARRALETVLPLVNHSGGSKRTVHEAVREIEVRQHPRRFLTQVPKLAACAAEARWM